MKQLVARRRELALANALKPQIQVDGGAGVYPPRLAAIEEQEGEKEPETAVEEAEGR
jgi:hypothetical protein